MPFPQNQLRKLSAITTLHSLTMNPSSHAERRKESAKGRSLEARTNHVFATSEVTKKSIKLKLFNNDALS